MKTQQILLLAIILAFYSCTRNGGGELKSFGEDIEFLKQHTDVLVLSDDEKKAQLAVVPAYQGRVMTSTTSGRSGHSLGWINHTHIASGKKLAHFNPYGGEDRFWLGPEGGQFSIFFQKGAQFNLDDWYTPAAFDTEPFEVIAQNQTSVVLRKEMSITNFSGTQFDLLVDRTVELLRQGDCPAFLGIRPEDDINMVGYQSRNQIRNTGNQEWKEETGLLSIWILGMFTPSPSTTIVIPFNQGPESTLGPVVNDTYFGKVPRDRLVVREGILYFSGDGEYRSKIGLSPQRAQSTLGSYDATNEVLTVVQFNKPTEINRYVNSMWEIQTEPFAGDAVNSYNDGPPEPGVAPLGPFYELETSSPAAALKPGESMLHTHRTFHFSGPEKSLNQLTLKLFGVTTADIKSALK